MGIFIRKEDDKTICQCDCCGSVAETEKANGVIVEGWMTGQLWLDESLGFQKQIPICFCSDCRGNVLIAERLSILPHYVEQSIEDETPIVDPVVDDPISPDAEYEPEDIEIIFETEG